MRVEILILISVILGFIPAIIAEFKGRSFLAWWVCGTIMIFVVLVLSLCLLVPLYFNQTG